MRTFIASLALLFASATQVVADWRTVGGGAIAQPITADGPGPKLTPVATAEEVLAEVNAARAKRGFPPFQFDEKLAEGAFKCAAYRAYTQTEGHTPNDFWFLPPGTHVRAAGCAAWPQGMGWGACCTYENWRYAGAAYVVGPDGKRYMHLMVR
jgi:hypothetical protein